MEFDRKERLRVRQIEMTRKFIRWTEEELLNPSTVSFVTKQGKCFARSRQLGAAVQHQVKEHLREYGAELFDQLSELGYDEHTILDVLASALGHYIFTLRDARREADAPAAALDEALNSGDGVYRP